MIMDLKTLLVLKVTFFPKCINKSFYLFNSMINVFIVLFPRDLLADIIRSNIVSALDCQWFWEWPVLFLPLYCLSFPSMSPSGLPCNCPDHFVSVCASNGRTYPSACVARCMGFKDHQFVFGQCRLSNPCANKPCPRNQRWVQLQLIISWGWAKPYSLLYSYYIALIYIYSQLWSKHTDFDIWTSVCQILYLPSTAERSRPLFFLLPNCPLSMMPFVLQQKRPWTLFWHCDHRLNTHSVMMNQWEDAATA